MVAVLLDLDDTLVDSTAAMIVAGRTAAAALWPQAGPERHEAAYAPAFAAHLRADGPRVSSLAEVGPLLPAREADLGTGAGAR
ncbi:MAG: hypothetical protein ACTHJ6_08455 [Oryzihumus sp.]